MPKISNKRSKKAGPSEQVKAIEGKKRREMIAREAYLRAEQRGFHGGDPVLDWLLAENKVDEVINQMLNKTA